MSSADDRVKLFTLFQKFPKFTFHFHIWIQYKKCIQMSTNKLSLGSVVLKISPRILKNAQILSPFTKIATVESIR